MEIHKTLRPTIGTTEIPNLLYRIGVSYHDFGYITEKDAKAKLFDYYACDSITFEQQRKIQDAVPLAQFKYQGKTYAPELKTTCVWIPKKAYYAKLKKGAK